MTGTPLAQLAVAVTVGKCAEAVPTMTPRKQIADAATRRSRTVRLYIVFLPHIFPSLHTSTPTDCLRHSVKSLQQLVCQTRLRRRGKRGPEYIILRDSWEILPS